MENTNINPETKIEETILETSAEETQQVTTEKKGNGNWKAVVLGGVPGVVLGVAGTLGTQSAMAAVEAQADPDTQEDINDEQETPVEAEETPIQVAENVNDEMSFGQAFAAARHEVGAGGVFEWRGNIYSTYYKEEWESMSDDEKHDFADRVAGVPPHTDANETETTVEPDPIVETEPADPVQIEIVNVEQVEVEGGQEVTVAAGTVDGHDMAMVDVDGDGLVDAALVDHNDNGIVDDGEVIDLEGEGIQVTDLRAMAEENMSAQANDPVADDLYAGMPDYSNDADISSIA